MAAKMKSATINNKLEIVMGTPCTKEQILDHTCEVQSAWAAVDAANNAALAAQSTVDLGIAGLAVGTLTLLAAFYAAWQAKRGADAAVHDARANAEAAKGLAEDRERELMAQARLHGAKIRFSMVSIRFDQNASVSLNCNIVNVGETAAEIYFAQIALDARLEGQVQSLVEQQEITIDGSQTLLPSEERQILKTYQLVNTPSDIVSANSWFETKANLWIKWRNSFDFDVFEKWVSNGTNVLGTIGQSSNLQLEWQEMSRIQ